MSPEKNKPKITYRIGVIVGTLMVAVALVYDAVQGLLTFISIGLLVNWIITLWATLTFWFWFTLNGVSFWHPTRAGSLGLGALIELIPGLNALPVWTAAVVIIWLSARGEDVLTQISPAAAALLNKVSKFKK